MHPPAAMHSPILVVEDDADVRSLLFEALTEVGGFLVYTVETAGAAQALMEGCGNSFAAVVRGGRLPSQAVRHCRAAGACRRPAAVRGATGQADAGADRMGSLSVRAGDTSPCCAHDALGCHPSSGHPGRAAARRGRTLPVAGRKPKRSPRPQ